MAAVVLVEEESAVEESVVEVLVVAAPAVVVPAVAVLGEAEMEAVEVVEEVTAVVAAVEVAEEAGVSVGVDVVEEVMEEADWEAVVMEVGWKVANMAAAAEAAHRGRCRLRRADCGPCTSHSPHTILGMSPRSDRRPI